MSSPSREQVLKFELCGFKFKFKFKFKFANYLFYFHYLTLNPLDSRIIVPVPLDSRRKSDRHFLVLQIGRESRKAKAPGWCCLVFGITATGKKR